MSAVGGNYMSDGAIMAWVATQQDRLYGDLKAEMDMAERRAEFTSALTNIKAHVAEANANKDFGAVDQEIQDFLAEYGSDPHFAEACTNLKDMAEVIHEDWQYKSVDYPAAKADYDAKVAETNSRVASAGPGALQNSSIEAQIPAEPRDAYTDEGLKRWTDMLDGQIDNSGRNDQLTMISIQELKATIDQGSQLASTLISSSDKTNSSILNNFV